MGRSLQVGVDIVVRKELADVIIDMDVNPVILGQWAWYLPEGEKGHSVYIELAYTHCVSSACKHSMYYK